MSSRTGPNRPPNSVPSLHIESVRPVIYSIADYVRVDYWKAMAADGWPGPNQEVRDAIVNRVVDLLSQEEFLTRNELSKLTGGKSVILSAKDLYDMRCMDVLMFQKKRKNSRYKGVEVCMDFEEFPPDANLVLHPLELANEVGEVRLEMVHPD